MANLSDVEIEKLPEKMQKIIKVYLNENIDTLSKFKNGNFSLKAIDIDTFCRVCKTDIDKNIAMDQNLGDKAR